MITQIAPALDGTFSIDLNPGKFLIILESGNSGIGNTNLPSEVEIASHNKTIFNIDIDTGIR